MVRNESVGTAPECESKRWSEDRTMCGRFSLTAPGQLWFEIFGLSDPPAWAPRYNIAPSQPVPTVLVAPDRPHAQFLLLRWGLIPSWAKAAGIGADMINARAETAATTPSRQGPATPGTSLASPRAARCHSP